MTKKIEVVGVDDEDELTCRKCGKKYETSESFLTHFIDVHNMTAKDIFNLPAFREALDEKDPPEN